MAQLLDLSTETLTQALGSLRPQVHSQIVYTERQKTIIQTCFLATTGNHFSAALSRTQAFLIFLLFLADSGGSEQASNTNSLTVETVDEDGNIHVEYGETYDTILQELRDHPNLQDIYTNRRMLVTFCDAVSLALKRRGVLTTYGAKNGIPATYLQYAFPGAEYCRNIPSQARTALSNAKQLALGRLTESGYSTTSSVANEEHRTRTAHRKIEF